VYATLHSTVSPITGLEDGEKGQKAIHANETNIKVWEFTGKSYLYGIRSKKEPPKVYYGTKQVRLDILHLEPTASWMQITVFRTIVVSRYIQTTNRINIYSQL
jgi:hypothetical protein